MSLDKGIPHGGIFLESVAATHLATTINASGLNSFTFLSAMCDDDKSEVVEWGKLCGPVVSTSNSIDKLDQLGTCFIWLATVHYEQILNSK